MCEFCHKHGEGKKWYLRAENYSEDLLSDVRRRKFIEEFHSEPERLRADLGNLEKLDRVPALFRGALVWALSNRQKQVHYGQVVPIEDLERIFEIVNTVVRLPCICRKITLGKEKRYCYGLSISPGGGEFSRAGVDQEKCGGCRQCMKVCQFGAMAYSGAEKKSVVDARRCYGCGICRAACSKEAISLLDRASVPASANLW